MNKPQTLAALRTQIATLKTKRKTLNDTPRARFESRADLDRQCLEWAADGDRRLGYQVGMLNFGSPIHELFKVQPTHSGLVDLGPVLAHVLGPERLSAALAVHLERHAEGPPATERAAQIAEVEAQLLEAEIAEERHIERLEEAGTPTARRADADPRAVLGLPKGAASNPPSIGDDRDVGIQSTAHAPQAVGRIAKSSYLTTRRE